MKICPFGAEFYHVDRVVSCGWADKHNKLIFAFCNFAHIPKNIQQYLNF